METAFNRSEFTTLVSVWDTLQQLVCEGSRETYANLKIFQMLSQTNVMTSTSDSQNQKSHIAVEKASSSSGKGEWRTYSAHFLLIRYWWFGLLWCFGVACVQAATQMMNRLQILLHGM